MTIQLPLQWQGHATTKIFNFIRNVVVMGQMLFLDSMEKNNFQLADGYPICTFSSFCELVGYFFFIGQLYYFTQLPAGKSQASWYDFTSWWNKKFLPAGKIVPACKMQSCCQLAGIRWVWYHCLLQWLSTCMARLAFHSPQQNVAARIAESVRQ